MPDNMKPSDAQQLLSNMRTIKEECTSGLSQIRQYRKTGPSPLCLPGPDITDILKSIFRNIQHMAKDTEMAFNRMYTENKGGIRMDKARKDELLKEADEAVAAISGCCDGLSMLGADGDDDDEYVSTIESNANKLLKIAKELAAEVATCKNC